MRPLLTALFALLPTVLLAADPAPRAATPTETAAERLLKTTVTVRISPLAPASPLRQTEPAAPKEVAVCSGAALGDGLIVTFAADATARRFRVTLADGGQAEALVRVTDTYSGLTLLQLDRQEVPALEPAADLPAIGGVVLTAAASGIEKPLVSRGILGGVDRSVPGSNLPPLLQCDVRTTEASGGAPVVDEHGRLVGIVAATGAPGEHAGWTYAVPVSHVQRLLRARVPDQVVVLKERRPVLGLTLVAGEAEGEVLVERVVEGSPAAAAGIQKSARITAVDDVKIRSVYQVQFLLLKKQPGDAIKLALEDVTATGETQAREIEVTLGGGFAVAPTSIRIGPSIVARRGDAQRITVENLSANEEADVRSQLAAKERQIRDLQRELDLSQTSLSVLQKQVDAFATVIRSMQTQLDEREQDRQETAELLKSLREELNRRK